MAETIITSAQDKMAADVGPITADMGMIVTRAAQRFGSRTALVADGRTLTYQALDDLCDRVAGGLHDIGVRPGNRVSLYSPNRWEWVVAYHAALRAGAVVNPINVMLTAEEVAFVLNDCGAAAIFTSGEKAEVIARPDPVRADLAPGHQLRPCGRRRHRVRGTAQLPCSGAGRTKAGPHGPVHHRLHLRHHRPPEGSNAVAPGRLP